MWGGCWGRCGDADACVLFIFDLLTRAAFAFSLRLLVLARLIVWVLRCGGADWCGLVLGRVESWVRALGFSPFFSFPGPPGIIRAADQKVHTRLHPL